MTDLKTIEEAKAFMLGDRPIILAKTRDCGVCGPVEKRVMEMYENGPWSIGRVYIEDVPLFRGEYTVFTVPTVIVFNEGREVFRSSRFVDFEGLLRITSMIDS